ncbi:hypothetical protein BDQ17DRAFT_1354211, partial [Cyathus striatus]
MALFALLSSVATCTAPTFDKDLHFLACPFTKSLSRHIYPFQNVQCSDEPYFSPLLFIHHRIRSFLHHSPDIC